MRDRRSEEEEEEGGLFLLYGGRHNRVFFVGFLCVGVYEVRYIHIPMVLFAFPLFSCIDVLVRSFVSMFCT